MVHRVGMVDDHESVIAGVAHTLSALEDIEVVGTARTVPEWLALGRAADLVVLDLGLADGSRVGDNIAALRRAGCQVLIFTAGDDAHAIRQAARAGVLGVQLKSAPLAELVSAVRAAARGDMVAGMHWAAALDGDPLLDSAGLSPREAEVLELYASGEKSGRVARILGISEHTVIEHLRSIRAKYTRDGRQAPTKVALYQRAIEDGYLDRPRRRMK